MTKPVFGLALGGFLVSFDGLTAALISGRETAPQIVTGIVIGSVIKGVVTGPIIGLVARRTRVAVRSGSGWASRWACSSPSWSRWGITSHWQMMLPGACSA